MSAIEIVAAVLILTGAGLNLIATIGIHRFPDVFARMHAASKPATLGLAFALVGTALVLGRSDEIVKLVLVIGFQFLTAPIAAHMIGRAAYRAGTELSPDTAVDELAAAMERPTASADAPAGWGERG